MAYHKTKLKKLSISMKILQINKFFYQQGGAERYLFNLIKLLEDNGHEVIPFTMADEKNQPTLWSKYFVSKVETLAPRTLKEKLRVFGRMIYSFEAKRKIENLIKEVRPDLVHLHNIYHQISPSILSVIKKFKIPIVMTVHDYKLICPNYILYTKNSTCQRCRGQKYYNALKYRCLKNSFFASLAVMIEMYFHKFLKIYQKNIDLFIAPSNFVKEKLIYFGLPANKIAVLPHFINPKLTEHQNCSPENYFLYLGRLKEEKGVELLLRAMKELPETNLKIIGTGPEEQALKKYVKENNLTNINFLGKLNQEKISDLIKNSLAIIIPSRVWETFGLTGAEALAYQKPVIASAMGGLPEIIIDGKTGLLFSSENIGELMEKMKWVLNNKEAAQKLGEQGYNFIKANLSPEEHYDKLMKIYEQVQK